MIDLFENAQNDYKNFTVFQDEAGCEKESEFFYHGFLFVDNEFGKQILNKLIEVKINYNERYKDISFKEIKYIDNRAKIVLEWLYLVRDWLISGKIRFYALGINKNNLGNFWNNDWNFKKNIYLKFFEIGLKSSIGWFKNDKSLKKPLKISHLLYEFGNYNDERRDKIIWLEFTSLWGILDTQKAIPLFSNEKREIKKNKDFSEYSNLIQLTDVLLGVCKYSFVRINPKHNGRQKCIDSFIDVIEKFNNEKSAYNWRQNEFYKKYCFNFFPRNKINMNNFLSKDFVYLIKNTFYCDRKTFRYQQGEKMQKKLL